MLKKNGLYASAYYLVSLLLPLALAPYASRVLGATGVGEVAYAQAIFIYFQLLAGLGSGTYGQRLIAQKVDEKKALSLAFFEVWVLKVILGLVGIVIFVSAINGLALPLKVLLYVQIIDLAINFVDISWFYQGIQDFKKVMIRQLGIKIVSVIFVLLFVKSESDGWIYLICFSLPTFFGYLLMWKNIGRKIDFDCIFYVRPFQHLKGLFILFIPYVAILLFAYIDRFLIGALTNDMAQVGFYDMSFRFVAISIGLSTAVASVLMPNIATAYANNEYFYIKNTLGKAFEISLFMGVLAGLSLYLVTPYLIPWFLGHDFLDAIVIVQVLSIVAFFKAIAVLLGSGFMIAIGRDKKYILLIWISLVINVGLNTLLIPLLGAQGAALASAISEGILVVTLITANRKFISSEVFRSSSKYLAAGVPVFLIVEMFYEALEPDISSTLIMLVLVWLLYVGVLCVIFKDNYALTLLRSFYNREGQR